MHQFDYLFLIHVIILLNGFIPFINPQSVRKQPNYQTQQYTVTTRYEKYNPNYFQITSYHNQRPYTNQNYQNSYTTAWPNHVNNAYHQYYQPRERSQTRIPQQPILQDLNIKQNDPITSAVKATKGKFFTYTLHSGRIFSKTVDVKWTATLAGKPNLPPWLHLFSSKHKAIAYLIGTPVTSSEMVSIHIIARKVDTFETAEQFLSIELVPDFRFSNFTQQIAELTLKDIDAEKLINNREKDIEKLESSIRQTFKGRDLNPYIFNIASTSNADEKTLALMRNKLPLGVLVQIGTQKKFHSNVIHLMKGLQNNFKYCNNSNIIPFNKYFEHKFNVNWCHFNIKNATLPKELLEIENKNEKNVYKNETMSEIQKLNQMTNKKDENSGKFSPYHHFWDSVLIFPLLAVICVILILVLSFIFFGRREGQHWRDYKTPKEQLQEYMSVRESQQKLRELSVQRQILMMGKNNSEDRRNSNTASGIQTFLQPKHPINESADKNNNSNKAMSYPSGQQPYRLATTCSSRSASRDPSTNEEIYDGMPYLGKSTTVGKQTVAEAAKATGSSLHLYKNPFDEKDEDEELMGHKEEVGNYSEIGDAVLKSHSYNMKR